MATLWIRQYTSLPRVDAGSSSRYKDSPQIAVEPGVDLTPVTFSTTTASAAFAASTTYIAIIASAAFHYVVASNPTATTDALKVPADTLVFLGVTAGQKIAAVTAA